MEQNVVKIKIVDTISNNSTIVGLEDLQAVPEEIKNIIQTVFPNSQLIFIGDIYSKLSLEMLYKTAKTVYGLVGQSLEWRITDKIPESLDLSAYLLLKS